jgi:hypothetical protein
LLLQVVIRAVTNVRRSLSATGPPLATHAFDFGLVVDFQSDDAEARLTLQWAKPPSEDHQPAR